MTEQAFLQVAVQKATQTAEGSAIEARPDQVAVEEPLEIRLGYGPADRRQQRSISITMRTPGQDAELAAGFLLSEGIIRGGGEIETVRPVGSAVGPAAAHNVVQIELRPMVAVDLGRLERHFYTTSSCGVCGKSSLEALELQQAPALDEHAPRISASVIYGLPDKLRQSQTVFDRTGGLHAAALFDAKGNLLAIREDVGRHNAVDKLVGSQLWAARLPLRDKGILVSGRASFELMQKTLMAGCPMLVAVGAPSSLAVELAVRFRMTLLGFVRDRRFNIYSGAWRLV
ncbi:MAG TPA: formate dehydrogenase accessory sulfurtransferase FdhD [Pirellulales bacterium]|nr:formate dehydrogenase accessory sulfurtransferase FdhD [Pirellulales bacterium]